MTALVETGAVRHLTTPAVDVQIDGDGLDDQGAATVASWWQSPGRDGLVFALLAQGTPVPLEDLNDAIRRELPLAEDPQTRRYLYHLRMWADRKGQES